MRRVSKSPDAQTAPMPKPATRNPHSFSSTAPGFVA
jgi:hypothetical protein